MDFHTVVGDKLREFVKIETAQMNILNLFYERVRRRLKNKSTSAVNFRMNGGDRSQEPVPVENRFQCFDPSTPFAFTLNNILIGAFVSRSLAKHGHHTVV